MGGAFHLVLHLPHRRTGDGTHIGALTEPSHWLEALRCERLLPNRGAPVNETRRFADTCCDTLSFPMTSTADDVALSRFSLADFAERDRMAAWRDLYGRLVLKADLVPLPDHSLHADVTVRMLPGLSITSASICRLFPSDPADEYRGLHHGGSRIHTNTTNEDYPRHKQTQQ